MFNPDLLTDEEWNLITRELVLASQNEEWKTILDLCESINKQCEELRKTLDVYKKEANSGSQN